MLKIESFKLREYLKNSEYLSFGKEIEALILKNKPLALGLADAFCNYQSALQYFENSITNVTNQDLPNLANSLIESCYFLYNNINEQIKINCRHFNMEKKVAATRLAFMINKHEKKQKEEFAGHTKFILTIIQELNKEAYKSGIKELGLIDWLVQLETDFGRYLELKKQNETRKVTIISDNIDVPARSSYEYAYKVLTLHFNAFALIDEGIYKELIIGWNACIERYQVIATNHVLTEKNKDNPN